AGDPVAEVLSVLVVAGRRGSRDRVERGASIGRDLNVSVVPAGLDLVPRLERERDRRRAKGHGTRHVVVEIVAGAGVIEIGAGVRVADVEVDTLVRKQDDEL